MAANGTRAIISLSLPLSLQPGLFMPDNLRSQSKSWPVCLKLPIGLYMTRQEQTALLLHICFMASLWNTRLTESKQLYHYMKVLLSQVLSNKEHRFQSKKNKEKVCLCTQTITS